MFQLSPAQAQLCKSLASSAQHFLIYGGARSGKTFLFCYAIVIRALMAPRSRHLIARLHNVRVRGSVLADTFPKMMELVFPGVKYQVVKSDQLVILPNGSEIWFAGIDEGARIEKILGREYATIYFNECSEIPYANVPIVRTRLAQSVRRGDGRPLALKAYYDLNPLGRSHWSHREFIDGVSPLNGMPLDPRSRTWGQLNPIDNPNLPAEALEELGALPSRLRQRFLEGKYLGEIPGALWTLDRIEGLRCSPGSRPELSRIVVAVDPSGSDGPGGDSQGIVVAGVGSDGHAYVMSDDSVRKSPNEWAKVAVRRYHETGADLLVAETNYGGAMVEATIRTADLNVAYKALNASRGKHVRAEPVAALYEQGRVHHVGVFPDLEDQLCLFTTAGYVGDGSPDRADALVWAISELMLETDFFDINAYIKAYN